MNEKKKKIKETWEKEMLSLPKEIIISILKKELFDKTSKKIVNNFNQLNKYNNGFE